METSEEQQMRLEKLGFGGKVKDKCVNRLELPQLALAFIFIGRGSRTPFQVGLYKNFQNKTKPTRITTGQTGRPDRSDRSASELSELVVNICPPAFW